MAGAFDSKVISHGAPDLAVFPYIRGAIVHVSQYLGRESTGRLLVEVVSLLMCSEYSIDKFVAIVSNSTASKHIVD